MKGSSGGSGGTVFWVVRQVIAGYLRSPWWFGWVMLAMGYQIAFTLFLPLITQHVFDDILPTRDSDALVVVALSIGAAVVGRAIASFVQEYSMAKLAARAMTDRRARLFENLQRKPATYFGRVLAAEILAGFSSTLTVVEGATTRLVPRTIYNVLNVASCLVVMAILDLRLAGVAMLALVVAFGGPRRLGARAAVLNDRRRDAENSLLATVQESVALNGVVRSYGVERWVRRSYEERLAKFREHVSHAMLAGSVVDMFTGVILAVVQGSVLCVGAWLVVRGDLSAGQFIAYSALIATIAATSFSLSSMIPPLIEASGGLARLEALVSLPASEQPTVALPLLAEAVRLESVTFSYTGERTELCDVSLELRAGTSTAIVGPSGSGKSTALSLITRAIQPQSGRVLLDGRDLAEAIPATLYDQMAIVAQESLLFNTSIRDNIRIGRLDATDAEVEGAARMAEIHDVIVALPRGYETSVGERGGSLSGGQRQRLAIARAILRNPRLLVLDEATSALDPATEQAVSRTLAQLGHGRTVVAVTHRLTTIMGCDRIYVMNDGGVAESGTHAELVEHQGLYRQLWDKQTAVAVNAGGEATLRPALLASLPLFAALGAAIRDELAEQFVTMKFGADHQLFRAGDPGDAFYVIARGQVVIEISAAGKPSRQRVLSDGDSFGEIALLDEQPRSATARTRTETTFLVLPRQRFLEAIARAPGLAAELRKKAAAHLASDSAFRQ